MNQKAGGVCPLCPFRRFLRGDRLLRHVELHHVARCQFVCSGTKQMRVVAALYDNDVLTGRELRSRYLERSASIIARSVVPPLSGAQNRIDKLVRLCLEDDGPHLRNAQFVTGSDEYRRARNLYHTRGFAEALRSDVLMHGTKVQALIPHIQRRSAQRGNHLASMMPTHVRHWWPLIEDIFMSPASLQMEASIWRRFFLNDEIEYISVDATLRITCPSWANVRSA